MAISVGKLAKGFAVTAIRAANNGSIPALDKALDMAGAKGIHGVIKENSATNKAMKANTVMVAKLAKSLTDEEVRQAQIKGQYITFINVVIGIVANAEARTPGCFTSQVVFKPAGFIVKAISNPFANLKFYHFTRNTQSAIYERQYDDAITTLNNLQKEYDKAHRMCLTIESKIKTLNTSITMLRRRI